MPAIITRQHLNVDQRVSHTANLFGANFPMQLEPYVYSITGSIASEYQGGYWEFYSLSNGGFYMTPSNDGIYDVCCENGYTGTLTSDALGIAACLYAYSHLSFGGDGFAELCGQHFHLLREFMLEHPEAGAILGAID